jgi:hypothetical protein
VSSDLTRRRFLAGLAAAPIVAACGGGDDDEAATTSTTRPPRRTTTSSTSTSTTVPPLLAPLTGLPWTRDPTQVTRPALVVKVSNADGSRAAFQARPQAGINEADVVMEVLTEGGVTRFVTIFHSTDAEEVGPVRSFRTTELDIVPALGKPLFAYSGANRDFLQRLRESGRVVDVGIDNATGAYRRVEGRGHDQSLMTSTPALYAAGEGSDATAPPQWFAYRADPDASPGAGAHPVAGVSYLFGGGAGAVPVEHNWDGRGWARIQKDTPHVDTAGVQVAPANVIVQFVEYRSTGAVDTSGSAVPQGQVIGDGLAWVFTNGQLVEGRWWKPDPGAVTTFTDANEQPIGLTPGRTWMALAPPGSAAVRDP